MLVRERSHFTLDVLLKLSKFQKQEIKLTLLYVCTDTFRA